MFFHVMHPDIHTWSDLWSFTYINANKLRLTSGSTSVRTTTSPRSIYLLRYTNHAASFTFIGLIHCHSGEFHSFMQWGNSRHWFLGVNFIFLWGQKDHTVKILQWIALITAPTPIFLYSTLKGFDPLTRSEDSASDSYKYSYIIVF